MLKINKANILLPELLTLYCWTSFRHFHVVLLSCTITICISFSSLLVFVRLGWSCRFTHCHFNSRPIICTTDLFIFSSIFKTNTCLALSIVCIMPIKCWLFFLSAIVCRIQLVINNIWTLKTFLSIFMGILLFLNMNLVPECCPSSVQS